jgi:hypothetical protein
LMSSRIAAATNQPIRNPSTPWGYAAEWPAHSLLHIHHAQPARWLHLVWLWLGLEEPPAR